MAMLMMNIVSFINNRAGTGRMEKRPENHISSYIIQTQEEEIKRIALSCMKVSVKLFTACLRVFK